MNSTIISISNLSKSFAGNAALKGLFLTVPRGSIYGFLGRNGAGKTTTLKILLGILQRDGGVIRLFNQVIDSEYACREARRRIAFVSEEKELYPFMTVDQTIRFVRSFFPAWRRDLEEKYLDLFKLPRNKLVPKLSKGMRAQLMLLLAMARGAELLLMDEPTSGLDPVMVEEVLHEFAALAALDGATIFFSSHQLAEVEQICDHICLIDDGKAVIDGDLDDLKIQYRRILLVFDREPPATLSTVPGIDHLCYRGRTASLLTHGDVETIKERIGELGPLSVEVRPVTLKELFLDHAKGGQNALV